MRIRLKIAMTDFISSSNNYSQFFWVVSTNVVLIFLIFKYVSGQSYKKINSDKYGINYYITKLAMHGLSRKDYPLS